MSNLGRFIRTFCIIYLALEGHYVAMGFVIFFSILSEIGSIRRNAIIAQYEAQIQEETQRQKENDLTEVSKKLKGIERVLDNITEISQDQFSNIFHNLQDIKVLCSRKSRESVEYSKEYTQYLDESLELIERMLVNKSNWIKIEE